MHNGRPYRCRHDTVFTLIILEGKALRAKKSETKNVDGLGFSYVSQRTGSSCNIPHLRKNGRELKFDAEDQRRNANGGK